MVIYNMCCDWLSYCLALHHVCQLIQFKNGHYLSSMQLQNHEWKSGRTSNGKYFHSFYRLLHLNMTLKLKSKPWITTALTVSIKFRYNLIKIYITTKSAYYCPRRVLAQRQNPRRHLRSPRVYTYKEMCL